MKQRKGRLIGMSVACLATGFLLLNVIAFSQAYTMTHFTTGGSRTASPEKLTPLQKIAIIFTGVNVPRPVGSKTPADLAPFCRKLMIDGPDGVRLETWYCDRGAETPLVILFHGFSAEKSSLLPEAAGFLDLAASVMLVDFRGSGGSSESCTTLGMLESLDVTTVFNYVRKNMKHPTIILFGQSMGAAAVLGAIHLKGINPDAIILESVFDSLRNTVRNRFRTMGLPSFPGTELLVFWGGWQWRFNGFSFNPADYAASVHCPAVLMHGLNDPRAKPNEGRRVFNALQGNKKWVLFPEASHESLVVADPDRWRAAVAGIITATGSPAE